ncbi:MAG TPA: glutathione S-transferase N-terminal domain-containing protein [Acetobacteraceae bacterium]|jgi:glutathione S-transferase|nr:glutathione S-transferase N-terminal domain-containing protein [Acetobacteraceae bacterium]
MMRLISATPSPYARKVRIALAEKAIPFELLTEVPWNNDTSLPRHNPLEKLPVLILEDGSTVYESSYILEWLERKYPTPALMPRDDDGWLAARKCLVLADGVCDAFLLVFFERRRPEAHQSAPWLARQMRKIDGGLAEMARIVGGQDYAVANRFTLADVGFGSVLGYFDVRFPELDWRGRHPNLERYFGALSQRDSFRGTVPYPQTIRDTVV